MESTLITIEDCKKNYPNVHIAFFTSTVKYIIIRYSTTPYYNLYSSAWGQSEPHYFCLKTGKLIPFKENEINENPPNVFYKNANISRPEKKHLVEAQKDYEKLLKLRMFYIFFLKIKGLKTQLKFFKGNKKKNTIIANEILEMFK